MARSTGISASYVKPLTSALAWTHLLDWYSEKTGFGCQGCAACKISCGVDTEAEDGDEQAGGQLCMRMQPIACSV